MKKDQIEEPDFIQNLEESLRDEKVKDMIDELVRRNLQQYKLKKKGVLKKGESEQPPEPIQVVSTRLIPSIDQMSPPPNA